MIDMVNTFNAFFNQYNGKPVEKEDPSALNNCMDLAFAWCDALQVDRATIRNALAFQVWTYPKDISVQYFEFVPNTPNGVPKIGDMVIFGTAVGTAGHICIASGVGDVNTFKSFDENWNGMKYATTVTHSYAGVLGWLRFRQVPDTSALQQQINALQAKINNAKAALA